MGRLDSRPVEQGSRGEHGRPIGAGSGPGRAEGRANQFSLMYGDSSDCGIETPLVPEAVASASTAIVNRNG